MFFQDDLMTFWGIPVTAEIFRNYSIWQQRVLLIRGRLMEMSNVNKFAIHNCNHLMLEQTRECLSPKARNCCTNTSTKALHVQTYCPVFPPCTSSRLSPSLVFPTYVLVTASFPETDMLQTLVSKHFWVYLLSESMMLQTQPCLSPRQPSLFFFVVVLLLVVPPAPPLLGSCCSALFDPS